MEKFFAVFLCFLGNTGGGGLGPRLLAYGPGGAQAELAGRHLFSLRPLG